MKGFLLALVLVLVLAFVTLGIAWDNLWSIDQKANDISLANAIRFEPHVATANSTVLDETFIQINKAANATTIIEATPQVGQLFVVTQIDSGTASTSVKLPTGVTWNGTNRSATFNAAAETLVGFAVSPTRIVILENLGSVGFAD